LSSDFDIFSTRRALEQRQRHDDLRGSASFPSVAADSRLKSWSVRHFDVALSATESYACARVEQLVERDRLAAVEPAAEVVALEHLRQCHLA